MRTLERIFAPGTPFHGRGWSLAESVAYLSPVKHLDNGAPIAHKWTGFSRQDFLRRIAAPGPSPSELETRFPHPITEIPDQQDSDMASAPQVDYSQSGAYDRTVFLNEFARRFKTSPHYNPGAAQNLMVLLGMIEKDRDIIDVRWAAYMLATTMWETTIPERLERPALNKKGKPILDKKGQQVMVKYRKWLFAMAPVDEVGHGAGRRYHEPVKITQLPDGNVRVTEHDGDQFLVKPVGSISKLTKHAKMGAVDGAPAHTRYEKDGGDEHVYFGRGYVQLTWWSNYAAAGVAMGRGLEFLLDPESVKKPEVAYKIMSYGMVNGEIFANNHSFEDFFFGTTTNYVAARKMVNGHDNDKEIADIALKFETVLLNSRPRSGASTPLARLP